MSLDFLTRPIGGKKTAADGAPDRPRRGGSAPNPEDVRRPGSLTIGGSPRVDLMPPEIRVKRSQLALRRRLRLGLVVVVVVVVAACGGTVAFSTLSGLSLAEAQAQTTGLLQQQAQYSEVKNATQSIQLIRAGQQVAGSTEIAWQPYLSSLAGIMPAGVVISSVDLDQATPVGPYTEDVQPLQGARIARMTITTESDFIPPVAQILASMEGLRGFVDVTPSDVAWQSDSSKYVSTITLHIDTAAFDGRFQPTPAPTPSSGGK